MILIKVVNGDIVKFPYTINDLRIENPTTSFPVNLTSEILHDFSTYQVMYQPSPAYDKRTQYVDIATFPILLNGVWTVTQTVIDKTPEAIDEYDASMLKDLKTEIFDQIDNKTTELIVYSFVYQGQNVRLSAEDQNNFEGEYLMIKEMLGDGVPASMIFPTSSKVWTNDDGTPVFIEFTDINEMKKWINDGKLHIKKCLQSGWDIKSKLVNEPLSKLQTWVDPR